MDDFDPALYMDSNSPKNPPKDEERESTVDEATMVAQKPKNIYTGGSVCVSCEG